MRSSSDKLVAVGVTIGVTLTLALSVTLTVLFVVGWKKESKTTDTKVAFESAVRFERHTENQEQAGSVAPLGAPSERTDASIEPAADQTSTDKPESGMSSPYVGGNYVSGRSTVRYVLEDTEGRVKMYGFDVMRGRRIFVGRGRMIGRRLIIPDFYSFLDDTHGTLKLSLSEDGKTFEGTFEGMDATKQAPVTLLRLP